MEQRPKAGAFKEIGKSGFSLWHEGRLYAHSACIDDLRFGTFDGWGKLFNAVEDYLHLAKEAEKEEDQRLPVELLWRSEDKYVEPPWRPWRYAHVQLELPETPREVLKEFRRLLSIHWQRVVAPDEFL